MFELILIFTNSLFYNQCFQHYTEVNGEAVKSEAPAELLSEVSLIMQSELGPQLEAACLNSGESFKFVQVEPVDAYSADDENHIYYTTDVSAWYNGKTEIPEGANLDVATLGTLIAHEIGHTPLGRKALNIPAINPHVQTQSSAGELVVSFSFAKIKAEEIRAVRLFENIYRKHIGIPLRQTYYEPGDVISH